MKRVIFIQPSVPSYRIPFFVRIFAEFKENLLVYGSVDSDVYSNVTERGEAWYRELPVIRNYKIFSWQSGVRQIDIKPSDCLVISGAPRCISNIYLMVKARLVGARVIWWGHFYSIGRVRPRFYLRLALMKLGHTLVFYTPFESSEYQKKYRWFVRRRHFSLNNSIEIGEIQTYRRQYSLVQRARRLVFVGRLTKKSELIVLIEAMSFLKNIQIALDVIGSGPELNHCLKYSLEMGVSDRITWHGSMHDECKIAELMNEAAGFVYPGAVGLSLLHAMSYGLPSIIHGNRSRQMPEFDATTENETGLYFSEGDAEDLAKKK